jgi:hypothetical protein
LSFDNLWCIKQPDGTDACMIRSFVESDDWEIYNEINNEIIERVRNKLINIRNNGNEPKLMIINGEDWLFILSECSKRKIEVSENSIFGMNVLQIPEKFRDNTFLNEGEAIILSNSSYGIIREVLKK